MQFAERLLGSVARGSDLGLRLLPFGHVAIDESDPAARHRVHPYLDDATVWPRALGRILVARRLDEPVHFRLDIDRAVFAMRGEIADIVCKARPPGEKFIWQTEDLLEVSVQRGKPQRTVEHRHPVAHVVEGDAQLGLPLADFVQQPRIVHRNDRLRRETLQQCNVFVREGADLAASARSCRAMHVRDAAGRRAPF